MSFCVISWIFGKGGGDLLSNIPVNIFVAQESVIPYQRLKEDRRYNPVQLPVICF